MEITPEDPKSSELDNQIFIYLRLRDEKHTLLKSRIREFAALSKLTVDFLKEIWHRLGYDTLKACALEYMDANTDMILVSIKQDLVRRQLIIAGLIPQAYQERMLSTWDASVRFDVQNFLREVASIVGPAQDFLIRERICHTTAGSLLRLISDHITDSGEFYIEVVLDFLSQEIM